MLAATPHVVVRGSSGKLAFVCYCTNSLPDPSKGVSDVKALKLAYVLTFKMTVGRICTGFCWREPNLLWLSMEQPLFVAKKMTTLTPAPERSGDGGFGSVPDTLLQETEAEGFFRCIKLVELHPNEPHNMCRHAVYLAACSNRSSTQMVC